MISVHKQPKHMFFDAFSQHTFIYNFSIKGKIGMMWGPFCSLPEIGGIDRQKIDSVIEYGNQVRV